MRICLFLIAAALLLAQDTPNTEFARTRFEVIVPLLRQARYQEAEKLTRELRRKAEAALPAQSLEIGRILFLLADCRVRQGLRDDEEMLALFERSTRIKAAALGPDHDETVEAELMYGFALHNVGRKAEAKAINERVLAIYERDPAKVSPAAAMALNQVAVRMWEDGEAGRARPYVERALAIAERFDGPESLTVAQILTTVGYVLRDSGDPVQAKAALARCLRIREKELGEDQRLTIAAYNNLAAAHTVLNEHAEAKRLFEKANAARVKLLGPEHPDNAIGTHNLGGLLIDMGDFAGARQKLDEALALRRRTLGEGNWMTGTTYIRLALADYGLARYESALENANQAVDILRRTQGSGHPNSVSALGVRAAVLARLGRTENAFNDALASARANTDQIRLSAQTEAERAALARGFSEYILAQDNATNLMLRHPDLGPSARREVWDLWIRSRAMVLDEISLRQRLVAQTQDPTLRLLHNQLQSARRRLSRLVLSAGTAEQIQETLERKEKLERELGERSALLRRDLARGKLGFADVAANLPAGSALVSFVRYREDRGGFLNRGVPVLLAFILRAGEEDATVVRLGDEDGIAGLIRDWRAQIALAASDPLRAGKRAEALSRLAGTKLRQRIWDPLTPHLRGVGQVLLVPDGATHLISFAALPVGADRYLVESGPLLHLLAAERDVVPAEETKPRENRTMLAMANPAFSGAPVPQPGSALRSALRSATPACADLRKMRFGPLPQTAAEVAEISRLWPSKPVVLSGAAASEAAFRAEAPGKRVLHVATHGFFLGEQCGGARKLVGEAATQSPLVLSGLALAGANQRQASDGEDGLLTAEEVAGLPLDGVEWVVLSGCDTGLGQIRAQEGVFGLRRAFQTAGAGTVIMSLWPVEDFAARDWMKRLYAARLTKGLSTAESLRDASRAMLAARRAAGQSTHPFFWAAFVGAGDWR